MNIKPFITLPTALLIGAVNVSAYESPKDFRQIEWGAPIGALEDMVVVDPGHTMGMYKRNEELRHADVDVKSIFYGFYGEQFFAAYVTYETPQNFIKIVDSLKRSHGAPSHSDPEAKEYLWGEEAAVTISLDYKDKR